MAKKRATKKAKKTPTGPKKKEKQVGLPETLYIEQPKRGELLVWETLAAAAACFDDHERKAGLTVGVYGLMHMARVTTEVKLTPCGPSKARR